MTITSFLRTFWLLLAITALSVAGAARSRGAEPAGGPPATPQSQPASPNPAVPAAAIIEPGELARMLAPGATEKPLIFQVGFRFLFKEAHIPGAEYVGPANKEEGLAALRKRAAPLARTRLIVLYCGCCPWIRCPNVKPAYDALRDMGFKQLKVLRIDENFGANWVTKGYPTAKGE